MKPKCTTQIVTYKAGNEDSEEYASKEINKLVQDGYANFSGVHAVKEYITMVFIKCEKESTISPVGISGNLAEK